MYLCVELFLNMTMHANQFGVDQEQALALDEQDPLREYRERFLIPKKRSAHGRDARATEEVVYLCGNSLGLQPKSAPPLVAEELEAWAQHGVDAHFEGARPWYSYHELFREIGARLVGAQPGEVVMMNSLTVNLHLMMTTFYQPTNERDRILIESPTFPSDRYAVESHLHARGITSRDVIMEGKPREGEHTIRIEDVLETLELVGDRIALILLSGVNFFTGQVFDMARITEAGRAKGCVVGFDLAHAAGNVPLRLHDWNVDFACWCSYKYLNAGPGAVAGCFIHERHGANPELPRFAGWWGSDPETRFRMQSQSRFTPQPGADGWQLSNPPILAMAPLKASLDVFDEVGMARLREKSILLTSYLRFLIEETSGGAFKIITPRETEAHGCQLSILVKDEPRARFDALMSAGFVCDFREPNVVRVAPVPLYNTFEDCWRFTNALASLK